jgi:hypothetical protein
VKLSTQLYLTPMLKTSGAIFSCLQYVLMTFTGTACPLHFRDSLWIIVSDIWSLSWWWIISKYKGFLHTIRVLNIVRMAKAKRHFAKCVDKVRIPSLLREYKLHTQQTEEDRGADDTTNSEYWPWDRLTLQISVLFHAFRIL